MSGCSIGRPTLPGKGPAYSFRNAKSRLRRSKGGVAGLVTKRRSLNLLFVEDSERDRELVELEFRRGGYDIVSARVDTREDMTTQLAAQSWDAVLADFSMPRFSALEALKVLKASRRDLPFIIVSGSIGEAVAVQAMREGVHDFVMKDNLTRLIPVVEREISEAANRRLRRLAEEELAASRRRTEILAEVGRVLVSSMEPRQIAERVARLLAPEFSDLCVVFRKDSDQGMEQLAIWPGDSELPGELARIIGLEESPLREDSRLLHEVPKEAREATGIVSWLAAPLRVRDFTFGMLCLVNRRSGRLLGPDVLALAEEIARRLSFAIENARLLEDAQAAVRARDEFLSIASHELKTPITSLKLHAQHMQRMLGAGSGRSLEPSEVKQMVEIANRQIGQLQDLIEVLLDVTKLQSGKIDLQPEVVNLSVLIRDICDRYARQIEISGCELSALDLEPGAIGLWDRTKLEQVFTNLLTNALKYARGSPIEIRVSKENGRAILALRDHGPGIPKSQQRAIFEKFERGGVKPSAGGLGLGLYITEQLVAAHGGALKVESEPGQGALFQVVLPLQPGQARRAATGRNPRKNTA